MANRHLLSKADEEVKERDVIKEAEDNLASVKATLAAIDDLSKRWEVTPDHICFENLAII